MAPKCSISPLFRILAAEMVYFGLECGHESTQAHAVHHAMIAAESEVYRMAHVQPAADDHWPLLDCAHRQDRYLRRIDHRRKLVNLLDHAQVTDRKCPGVQVLRAQPVFSCSFDQRTALGGKARERV